MAETRDRRAVLADAAIELTAARGLHGLTHRSVDAQAGLPPGTTSAYFRTRAALVTAMARRIAELDRRDLERHEPPGRPLTTGSAHTAPGLMDHLADTIAALVEHLTTTARSRTVARYACLLETVHRPELREVLAHGEYARTHTRDLFIALGVTHPDRCAHEFVASVDGIILNTILDSNRPTPAGTGRLGAHHGAIRRLLGAAAAAES